MGQEIKFLFQGETKRLLWVVGILFAVILVFQYFELPSGNVLFSLFSAAGKIPLERNDSTYRTGDEPYQSEFSSNTTLQDKVNSTGENVINEWNDNTETSSEGKESKPDHDFVQETTRVVDEIDRNSTLEYSFRSLNNGSTAEQARRPENSGNQNNDTTQRNYSTGNSVGANTSARSVAHSISPAIASTSTYPPGPVTIGTNITSPLLSNSNCTVIKEDVKGISDKSKSSSSLQGNSTKVGKAFPKKTAPEVNKGPQVPISGVISISDMNKMLLRRRASFHSVRPQWSSTADQELLDIRSQIENAPIVKNDPTLYAPIYRNISMFRRSYELMESTLKVYVYREGAKPILHTPLLKGIYASEGWFMKLLESNKRFVTKDPNKAHLFYLPFSSRLLEEALYVPNSHSHKNLIKYLKDYVDLIAGKYNFWNRTWGADHFLVACHDWAPSETRVHMANCIRALCNSDVKEGFVFGKDVSLPETNIRSVQNPTKDLGGKATSKKLYLAFFAGRMHGYVRPILLQDWENKDPDMKIFGKLPKSKGNRNYIQYMKSSKYCICAKGYEVNSPRVVEAIFYECVPVIISDNFVPPFFEVLNWESFAVFVLEKDIPNLKAILQSIPQRRYLQMQMRVKKVQQHFLWHTKPAKYDIFHMILHSIWYNRVFNVRE